MNLEPGTPNREPRPLLERARDVATAALPWGILGLMGLGLLGGQVSESIERLVQQNGAVLLLAAIIIQYAPRAIDAQKQQAAAMADLGAAVRELTAKDSYVQREVLGVLRVLAEDMQDVKKALDR